MFEHMTLDKLIQLKLRVETHKEGAKTMNFATEEEMQHTLFGRANIFAPRMTAAKSGAVGAWIMIHHGFLMINPRSLNIEIGHSHKQQAGKFGLTERNWPLSQQKLQSIWERGKLPQNPTWQPGAFDSGVAISDWKLQ